METTGRLPIRFLLGMQARPAANPGILQRLADGIPIAANRLQCDLIANDRTDQRAIVAREPTAWGMTEAVWDDHGRRSYGAVIGDLHETRALMQELGVPPHEDFSDAALVLYAWHRWGRACSDHLLGDYAFFCFDNRGRAFASVGTGISSWLFYRVETDTIRFATHPLLLVGGGDRVRLEGDYFARWLTGALGTDQSLGLTGSLSPFAGIRYLRAGHAFEVNGSSSEEFRHFVPPPPGTTRYRNRADYQHHWRALVKDAVRCRLANRKNASIALSGGIDSCAVAVCASELVREGAIPGPVTCISYGTPDLPRANESSFARRIATSLGLEHVTATTPAPWNRSSLQRSALHQGFPSEHLFMIDAHAEVARKAADVSPTGGYTLSGGAGELVLADLDYVFEAACDGRAFDLLRAVPSLLGVIRARRTRLVGDFVDYLRRCRYSTDRSLTRAIRRIPSRPQVDPRLHPAIRMTDWLAYNLPCSAILYGLSAWRKHGAVSISPYNDRRINVFAGGIPIAERLQRRIGEHWMTKPIARAAFPEVPPDLSRQAGFINLNEDVSARWAHMGARTWLEAELNNLPPTITDVIDVRAILPSIDLLDDPLRSPDLLSVASLVWWIAAVRNAGITVV